MAKKRSRPEQWADACQDARGHLEEAQNALAKVADAFGTLKSLQEEYEGWRDGMSENLQGSPTYEKLEAVCELDLDMSEESCPNEIAEMLDEAEGIELPRGWGRD
jgi:hypothetical protein